MISNCQVCQELGYSCTEEHFASKQTADEDMHIGNQDDDRRHRGHDCRSPDRHGHRNRHTNPQHQPDQRIDRHPVDRLKRQIVQSIQQLPPNNDILQLFVTSLLDQVQNFCNVQQQQQQPSYHSDEQFGNDNQLSNDFYRHNDNDNVMPQLRDQSLYSRRKRYQPY